MWDPVAGADGYAVQFRLDSAFSDADPVIVILARQTSYRSGPLLSGTSVYLRVLSFRSTGENRFASGWSASVVGTTTHPLWPKFGEFTDSQGRTITYGLHFRGHWDPNEPRGVAMVFHGNNTGTQEEMSTRSSVNEGAAFDLGLVVAYVGSPAGYYPPTESGAYPPPKYFSTETGPIRFWKAADERLVHELLQSGFDGNLTLDHDRVLFIGGSQGTGFLVEFLERYLGIYGGGFYARCGPFRGDGPPVPPPRTTDRWAPSFPWTPLSTSRVQQRFRVFVQTTTEDRLHPHGVRMANYYGNMLGLETRSDLSSPGGHCASGSTPSEQIWEWLMHAGNRNPVAAPADDDVDGDGIPNVRDHDDDNDGAWDAIDALPLDARDWLDTDGDSVGNFEDRDADGDGASNAEDAFALDPREWLDTDGDGIGNNLDSDDDNDGLPDASDELPLEGLPTDQLSLHEFRVTLDQFPYFDSPPAALLHAAAPAAVVYPGAVGDRQSYQYIQLGNGPDPRFQIMIDRIERNDSCDLLAELCTAPPGPLAYFEHFVDLIYIDRDQSGNLTDDGPPLVLARNRDDELDFPGVRTRLSVTYASGETLPYEIRLWTSEHLSDGVRYMGTSSWMGYVRPPVGEAVLVGVADVNVDGLFDSEGYLYARQFEDASDVACVDTNRNDLLDECLWLYPDSSAGIVKSGETFTLDGRTLRIVVAPTGYQVEIRTR